MTDADVEAADDRVLLELRLQRVVRRCGLGEGIADGMAVVVAVCAVPLARQLIVADLAALHLQHQHAKVRVGDDEVGFAVACRGPGGAGEPCDAVEDGMFRPEKAREGIVDSALGVAARVCGDGGGQRSREHRGHAGR